MSGKFHITDDGPKPCTAQPGNCPVTKETGGEHYNSFGDAQVAYEDSMNAQTLTALSKHETVDDFYTRSRFSIAADKLEQAEKSIAQANRRLEKAGIDERFEMDVKERFVPRSEMRDGVLVEWADVYYDIELSEPKISYNGYTFLAVMDKEQGGFITRTAEGVELGGWRPESMYCEHCGQRRSRAKTYLIEDEEGNRKQIGSTCVEAYLGLKPKGLWALEYDDLDELKNPGKSEGFGPYSARNVDQTLAFALAVSDGGDNFIPRSWGYGSATVDDVDNAIFGGKQVDSEWRNEMADKAAEYIQSGQVAALKSLINKMDDSNDYVNNLKTAVASDYVSPKTVALLVSGVASIKREKNRLRREAEKAAREKAKEERAALFKSGYVGQVGDKIPKGTKYNLVDSTPYQTRDYRGYEIIKYRITMVDDDGHQIVYFSPKPVTSDEDGNVTISSATIKKHSTYEEQDQTILSRVFWVKPKKK